MAAKDDARWTFKGYAEAFMIFAKYTTEIVQDVHAEHDIIHVSVERSAMTDDDLARLAALDWLPGYDGDESVDGFYKFV